MSEDQPNPFASPQTTDFVDEVSETTEEAIRREYISHETSVRSLALIFLIVAGGYLIFPIVSLVRLTQKPQAIELGILIGLLVLGFVLFAIAIGLRMLSPIARVGASTFVSIGLIGFPFLTIICAYVLFLFWSRKGRMVFSSEYKTVIKATPNIYYESSIALQALMWILLVIVALVFIGCVAR